MRSKPWCPHGWREPPEAVELDLAERAATLFDERSATSSVLVLTSSACSRAAGNERAFQRMKQILTAREQWLRAQRSVRARRRRDRRPVATHRAALRGRVVAEEITGERGKAIEYYERILELDPLHESGHSLSR
jgi:tetratricopeptide (TPR) repeat protein